MPDAGATDTETKTDDDGEVGAGPARNTSAAAWIVVLVIGGLAVALLVTLSFSANNTGVGVDGRSATTSQYLDE